MVLRVTINETIDTRKDEKRMMKSNDKMMLDSFKAVVIRKKVSISMNKSELTSCVDGGDQMALTKSINDVHSLLLFY